MSSVGSYLRELRERRGVSVEEIARSTRVLHRYLDSLEADDFASLPAPVFTKGFIRAYCQVLGEPPDEALALWAARAGAEPAGVAEVPARQPAHAAERAADGRSRARGTVLVSFVLLVVLGLALFVTTLALQSGRSVAPERRASGPVAVPGPVTPPAPARPAPSQAGPTPASGPSTVTTPASPPAALPTLASVVAPYRLVARTTEATWIRVRTEDGRSSEETVPPGEVREWVSNRPFVLTIGNAGGVTFELNGRPLPLLGRSGEVIARLVLPAEAR